MGIVEKESQMVHLVQHASSTSLVTERKNLLDLPIAALSLHSPLDRNNPSDLIGSSMVGAYPIGGLNSV